MARYAIVTAAFNEEKYIGNLLQSVMVQTVPPVKWVVVDDNSNDRTADIVSRYQGQMPYLVLLRQRREPGRSFGSKVVALRKGIEAIGVDYDYLAFLDADITLDPDYYEKILKRFDEDKTIGIAGGNILQKHEEEFRPRRFEVVDTMPNSIQTFRRTCYESIGGLVAMPFGGEDTSAEVKAKVKGWKVRTFDTPLAYHHRLTSSAGGLLRGRFTEGKMDYTLGNTLTWELGRCLKRITEKPVFLGSLTRMAGYMYAILMVREIFLDQKYRNFVQKSQREKFKKMIGWKR